MRFIYFIYFVILFSPLALAKPISTKVDGGYSDGKHMQCRAYLSGPSQIKQRPPRLLFNEPGTGVYTTYPNHLRNLDDYYLSIDKPGILPDLKNPDHPIVNRALFDYYTINTLVTCAQNALYWADDYLKKSNPKIILIGHSEGSSVMINVLYNTYADNNKKHLQHNIIALFLSSAVIEHMSDVLTFQFKGKELQTLMTAYQQHDSDYLFNHYMINWYWLNDAFNKDKSKLVTLESLAKLTPLRSLPIEIFQGLLDEDVPTKVILNFEKKNQANPANKKLNLQVRYYNAGHELNDTAISDMNALQQYYFQHNKRRLKTNPV